MNNNTIIEGNVARTGFAGVVNNVAGPLTTLLKDPSRTRLDP
jgi:hypothetical protein